VNTCGFIEPARQESLETLQALAADLHPTQRLMAAGCWAQRSPDMLLQAIPELDAVLGTRSWSSIVSVAQQLLGDRNRAVVSFIEDSKMSLPESVNTPGYAISGASAFLKIADGCSRQCAFCAIPAIKGPTVSRAMDAILADAQQLQNMGILEINLIAQDVTYYGYDLNMNDGLAVLLERLVAGVPRIPWLRILYAFPGYVTPRLIDVIAQHPQILPYIDIPLQHAHPEVLRRMRRPANVDGVRRTIAQLRETIPDVALRTTLIAGFPGETDAEFQTLLDFVEEMHFDRVGVFLYSQETGTVAATLVDDVPYEVKAERREKLMLMQQSLSQQANQRWVGKQLSVLIEGSGDGLTVGRSYRDAPEIDGLILIPEELAPNQMVTVEITEAMPYDLVGRVVNQ
jgi:ribosomal protein S12 methylthiotransferase